MKKAIFSFFLVMTFALVPAAFAQLSDHAVIMHFDQAVEIPGQVLQPGTYQFVVPESPAGIVQVYDAHRTKMYGMLQSISAARVDATSDFKVKIADDNGKQVLMGWFAPGETTGYELLYPKEEMKQLSANERTVSVGDLANSAAYGD